MTSALASDQSICLRAVEFRSTTTEVGDGRTLEGYAAVFGVPTRIQSWEGEFDEEIVAGAFRKTLKKVTPVLQFDHGRDQRTGTVPIGAVDELTEDEQGLFVRARLFDNPVVEPIRQAIEGKAITGMSFRFQVSREQWFDREGVKVKEDELPRLLWEPGDRGPLKRSILEIDPLYELGPVVFPAYDATSVGVRSLLAQLGPEDRRSLIRELAADLRRAADIPDLTGQAGARSSSGGGAPPDAEPGNGDESARSTTDADPDGSAPPTDKSRARSLLDRDLRVKGIIK